MSGPIFRFGLLLLSLLAARPAASQKLYRIQHFSPKYYGKVWLAQPGEVFSPGWVAVYDQATGKQLLKTSSEELAAEVASGQVKANAHELPYGEQSVLLYEDFNFDGIKDFALEDGHNSCYHGPSFRIYLAKNNGFVFSEGFTQLAREYCGMFGVDKMHKKLSTSTKDGCYWHQFSQYVVRNNQPLAIEIVEEDLRNIPYGTITTQTWKSKKMVVKTEHILNLTDTNIKPLLSFTLAATGKKLVVFNNDDKLSYALLKPTGNNVEFSYPAAKDSTSSFTLNLTGPTKTLDFKNDTVGYQIYENQATIGIKIITPGKTVELMGNTTSKKGGLAELTSLQIANLKKE